MKKREFSEKKKTLEIFSNKNFLTKKTFQKKTIYKKSLKKLLFEEKQKSPRPEKQKKTKTYLKNKKTSLQKSENLIQKKTIPFDKKPHQTSGKNNPFFFEKILCNISNLFVWKDQNISK